MCDNCYDSGVGGFTEEYANSGAWLAEMTLWVLIEQGFDQLEKMRKDQRKRVHFGDGNEGEGGLSIRPINI